MGAYPSTVGVILAGGLARRLGGVDKPLLRLGGGTVLDRLIERLRPQVSDLVINANGDPLRFAAFTLPVVADSVPGRPGPLAGVLAGLEWTTENRPDAEWTLTVTGDAPFVPRDLVSRLHAERGEAVLATAATGGQIHHAIGLWPVQIVRSLREALFLKGLRQVGSFAELFPRQIVFWEDEPVDPFFNINTAQDLRRAERIHSVSVAVPAGQG